jgi:NDP-sugar pyrophosphorylase family protein
VDAMRAVILAGGRGTRLRPYTITLPKPLVPVGDEMPILEIIILQLSRVGFDHITLAVNHMANLIMAFFGDGARWGVKIDYSLEETPLSTIGPLTLIPDLPENFLVMNGDILCDLDYSDFFRRHVREGNEVTVSVYQRSSQIDFGVLSFDAEHAITNFIEKPVYHFDVSMGVYCIRRDVVERLAKGQPYGFDNLMLDGIKDERRFRVVPFDGYWLDIGRPDDFAQANENFEELKLKLGLTG